MKHPIALILALAAAPAFAQVQVKNPWVRATVAGQTATGAFMQITSKDKARLVAGSSPLAGAVEIHEMIMDGNVMKMRAVAGGIELTPGKAVELKPGGYHVMLMSLKNEVKAGSTVPMTLVFEKADGKRESVEVKAPVRPLNAQAGDASKKDAHKH